MEYASSSDSAGCGCEGACCSSPGNTDCCKEPGSAKTLIIDFLYIDLTACSRCLGTDSSLAEALDDVAKVLEATGTRVEVRKILVDSEETAIKHKFVSSPTIRINGQDIQMETRETLCESCSDICEGEEIECRVWVWQGQEYNVPPKGMIVEAILKHLYGGNSGKQDPQNEYAVPDNLKRFFAAAKR